eukprot:13761579-Alexandrium_andersonii.AAC.1
MSASLVGSEMCIRDRSLVVDEKHAESRDGKQSSPQRRPWPKRVGAFTVSYTHLTLPTICSV